MADPALNGWATNGSVVNPAAGAVLALTPALSIGFRRFSVVVSYGATGGAAIFTRLASNGSTPVKSHFVVCGANQTVSFDTLGSIFTDEGEFMVLTNNALIVAGTVCGSIFYE